MIGSASLAALAVAVMFVDRGQPLKKPPSALAPIPIGSLSPGSSMSSPDAQTPTPAPRRSASRSTATQSKKSDRPFFAYQVDTPTDPSHTPDVDFLLQRTDGSDRTRVAHFAGVISSVCGGGEHQLVAVNRDRSLFMDRQHTRDCAEGTWRIRVIDRSANVVFQTYAARQYRLDGEAFSHDSRIAVVNRTPWKEPAATIDTYSLKDGSHLASFSETEPSEVSWSPGGMLAYVAGSMVVTANPDGSGRHQIAHGSNPEWLDDQRVVFRGSGGMFVHDASFEPGLLEKAERRFSDECLDHEVLDSDRIVCFTDAGEIWAVRVSSGDRSILATGVSELAEIAVVTANEIVFGTKAKDIYSLRLGATPVKVAQGHSLH